MLPWSGPGFRLAAMYAASFIGFGVHTAFFPVWLDSKALTPAEIGLVMAVAIVARVLASAPLLALADRDPGPRRILILSHLGQACGFPVLFVADGVWAIGALSGLLAIAQAAILPGNDLVTTQAIRRHPHLHYGRIRVWGSLAFLCATIGSGYLIDAFGAGIVPLAIAAPALLAVAITWITVPVGEGRGPARSEPRPQAAPIPGLLWLIMASAAFVQACHGAIYAFGSIHWRAIGFSDASIGALWAIGVLAEIIVFILWGQAVGRGSSGLGLLLASAAAAVVRLIGLSVQADLAATYFFQALHGLTIGASHLGAMAALTALSPPAARGRAQGMLASANALGIAAATIAAGPIYRAAGPAVFVAMAPLGAIGFGLALVALRRSRAQPQSSGEGGETTLPR